MRLVRLPKIGPSPDEGCEEGSCEEEAAVEAESEEQAATEERAEIEEAEGTQEPRSSIQRRRDLTGSPRDLFQRTPSQLVGADYDVDRSTARQMIDAGLVEPPCPPLSGEALELPVTPEALQYLQTCDTVMKQASDARDAGVMKQASDARDAGVMEQLPCAPPCRPPSQQAWADEGGPSLGSRQIASDEDKQDLDDEELSSTWSCKVVCDDLQEACPRAQCLCCGSCTLLVVAMAILLLAVSLETIDSTEIGIAYNAPQAILSQDAKEEGLHTRPPFGHFILWPRTHQTLHQTIEARSKDGIIVSLQVAFQYKVSPVASEISLHALTREYKDFIFYKEVVRFKSRSGIRNACMRFTAMQFQTQRAAVQARMAEELSARLSGIAATVYNLQLTSINRPPEYEAAVDAKESARNQIILVTNRKAQTVTNATTQKLRAVVQAQRIVNAAKADADVILKNSQSEADIIYGRYTSQGATYKNVREGLNLTARGLLVYIATRFVDELENITVVLPALAKVAYNGRL